MTESTPGGKPLQTSSLVSHVPGVPLLCGRNLLLAFACSFPLITAARRLDSNQAKFYAVGAFAVLFGVFILQRIREQGWSWHFGRSIWAVLSAYAVLLIGGRFEALLIPAVFFVIIEVIGRGVAGACSRHVVTVLVVLVAVVVLSCFATVNQYLALIGDNYRKTGLVTFGCCVVVFMATVLFLTGRTDCGRAVRCLLAGGLVVSCVGLVQFFGRGGFVSGLFPQLEHHPGVPATLGHPNWYGTYLLLLFPLAVCQFFETRKPFWGLVCGLLWANIVAAQTRGAWIAATIFMIILLISRREQRRQTVRLLVLLFLVTLFLLPWNDWQVLKRAETLPKQAELAAEGSIWTGSGRFGYWKSGLQNLPRHAILGAGLDTFAEIAPPEKSPLYTNKAHSIYVEYAVTIGIPGLILYLLFLWRCTNGDRRNFLQWTFRATIITYFVQGIFIHDMIQTWPLVWFVAGLAVVASREDRPASPEPGPILAGSTS